MTGRLVKRFGGCSIWLMENGFYRFTFDYDTGNWVSPEYCTMEDAEHEALCAADERYQR